MNYETSSSVPRDQRKDAPGQIPEHLMNIKKAAQLLGVHDWALRRAVNSKLIPSYTLLNSRRLVRLSEVIAAINASKVGGGS